MKKETEVLKQNITVKPYKTDQKGFTLIELLLVIALVAISVGITTDILLSLVRSYNKTTVLNEIEQEANFVSLKLEKELRNAQDAGSADSGKELTFNLYGDTICYKYFPSVKNLYRTVGSCLSSPNSDYALVGTPETGQEVGGVALNCDTTNGCFSLTGASPQVVGIEMVFQQAQAGAGVSYSGEIIIKNTFVIRNTYQ